MPELLLSSVSERDSPSLLNEVCGAVSASMIWLRETIWAWADQESTNPVTHAVMKVKVERFMVVVLSRKL